MRNLDALPAWAERQRNRRLVRHGDQKVVRWINHNQAPKDNADTRPSEPSTNDNIVAFAPSRSA